MRHKHLCSIQAAADADALGNAIVESVEGVVLHATAWQLVKVGSCSRSFYMITFMI